MKHEKIFVVGHRNPDTDSICSAIAYAELRRRQGLSAVRAARAGNINYQTEFVLERLGVDIPELLADVYPRIKDVVTEDVVMIDEAAPMSKAVELYHKHSIRMLPVIDAQQRPKGLLLLKKASEVFLLPAEPDKLRRVHASLESIRSCLGATAHHLIDPEQVENLDMYVGARCESSFSRWVDEIRPERTILISGDRVGIQQMAIEAGVRLLIITGTSEISHDLISQARKKNVSILASPYDTANSVWLTRMATPVGSLIGDDFITVTPSDLLEDLRLKLMHSNSAGAIVVSAEGKVTGVATKSHLIKSSPSKLILVDHNELSQAVPGAEKVEILEVIDHHRLGNFHTDTPIRFINQPLGSTCSLVATLYQQAGIEPEQKVAGLLLSGLLSDTVILKSPTTTEIDRQLVPWLEKISGLEHEEFGRELFASGSPMASGVPAKDLILTDFKEYRVGDHLLGVGQVEVVNFHSFLQRRDEIMREIVKLREKSGYELAALLVTDIVMETSLLLTAGPNELPYMIGYPQEGEGLYRLKGVLSRKKQLVPHLLKVFKGEQVA